MTLKNPIMYDEDTVKTAELHKQISELKLEQEHNAVYKPSHYEKEGYPSTQVMVRAMFAGTEGKLPLSVYPWWKDAFKYIFRWPLKNGVEDLKKAKRCIDMIIEELEAAEKD